MKNKLIIIIVIAIISIIFIIVSQKGDNTLIIPGFTREQKIESPQPTPAPPVAPKEFKFDRSTDLKMELEKVNPEVLDSDFE